MPSEILVKNIYIRISYVQSYSFMQSGIYIHHIYSLNVVQDFRVIHRFIATGLFRMVNK